VKRSKNIPGIDTFARGLGLVLLLATAAPAVHATVIGLTPAYPKTTLWSIATPAVSYDAASGQLDVAAIALATQFSPSASPVYFNGTPGSVNIGLNVNSAGALVAGRPGADFSMTGSVDGYSGALLSGEVSQFGFDANSLDFLFHVTGGAMAPLFGGRDMAVTLGLESGYSGFDGSFQIARLKGTVGVAPSLPPSGGDLPDPPTVLLLGAGLPGLLAFVGRRRRRRT